MQLFCLLYFNVWLQVPKPQTFLPVAFIPSQLHKNGQHHKSVKPSKYRWLVYPSSLHLLSFRINLTHDPEFQIWPPKSILSAFMALSSLPNVDLIKGLHIILVSISKIYNFSCTPLYLKFFLDFSVNKSSLPPLYSWPSWSPEPCSHSQDECWSCDSKP